MGSVTSACISTSNPKESEIKSELTLLICGRLIEPSCCYGGDDFHKAREIRVERKSENPKAKESQQQQKSKLLLDEPEPLHNWTFAEQKIIIDSLNDHPQARDNIDYRRRLIVARTRSQLPEKSLEEIEECYKHLQAARISYFLSMSPQSQSRRGSMFQT